MALVSQAIVFLPELNEGLVKPTSSSNNSSDITQQALLWGRKILQSMRAGDDMPSILSYKAFVLTDKMEQTIARNLDKIRVTQANRAEAVPMPTT